MRIGDGDDSRQLRCIGVSARSSQPGWRASPGATVRLPLNRLENGQQLNPTVNTLARYGHALGKSIAWSLCDRVEATGETPQGAGNGRKA